MNTPMLPSTTNVLSAEWPIKDEVTRLRAWASDHAFPLFADRRGVHTIGTAPSCAIQVQDPKRRVSREHAHVERIGGRWCVVDRGSKNGLFLDGVRCDKAVLTPGVEIGLGGGVMLVAESTRSIALRNGLARMIGWSAARADAVDLAVRAIRLAATRRAILVLCGQHDLVPLAEELHRLTLTAERPFVLCNPRRRTTETVENPIRCVTDGLTAIEEAAGGTVCLYHKYLPPDLIPLLRAFRRPESQTQLVLCSVNTRDAELFNTPIVIPPLTSRKAELGRLIDEYTAEAAHRLEMDECRLSPAEREWIRDHVAGSLPDIQKATLRLAAIHQAGSSSAGAARLGISHWAMCKWLRNNKFPLTHMFDSPDFQAR